MSNKIPSNINFKVPGFWNRYIFSPEWILKNLFENEGKTAKLEILFNPTDRDLGYNLEGIKLFVRPNLLEINLDKDNEKIPAASKILSDIFKLLTHTPIMAMGFNVNYEEDENSECSIIKIFNQFKLVNFDTYQMRFSQKHNNYNLKVIITKQEKLYIINFNFHFDKILNFADDFFVNLYNISQNYMKDDEIWKQTN